MTDLPANVEAEAALLGGLLNCGQVAEVAPYLDPGDFTVNAHRTVYDACVELAARFQPVEITNVTAYLADAGTLDHVGGAVALYDLTVNAAPAASLGFQARRVSATARRRNVIRAARQLAIHAQREADGLDTAIDTAVEAFTARQGQSGIVARDGLELAIAERLASGGDPGVSTGWDHLDRFYRVPRGMVTVVTGVPGHGKSTWVDALIANLARLHDWRFAMFSPEQSPSEKHALRLIQTVAGEAPEALGDRLSDAMSWTLDRFVWLDDQADNTLAGVLSRARLVASRDRLDGLVIDPWNKLSHDRGRHSRDDLYLQDALHRLTRFARQTGVHVWVIAHPLKMHRESPSSSRWQTPSVYDISGGSEWNNQADAIISVWRDQDGEEGDPSVTEVAVQKVRDQGVWGQLGGVRMQFVENKRRFFRQSVLEAAS
jgi:replicative DNA helicase